MHSCLLEMVPHYPRPTANKNGVAERNGNLQRCSIVLMWPLKPLSDVFEIPSDTDMTAQNKLPKYITNMIHIL